MAMQIIVGKKKLVIAGDWALFTNKRDAKRHIKQHARAFVVDRTIGADRVIGAFQAADIKSGGALAGALAVAGALENAIVAHTVSDDKVWLCVVRERVPVPGYDQICSAADAIKQASEMMAFNPDAIIVGDVLPASTQTLEQVLASVPKKQLAGIGVVNLRKQMLVQVSLLAALGAMMVIGLVLYDLHEKELEAQSKQSLQQRSMQAEQGAKNAAANTYIQSANDAITKQREAFAKGVRIADVLNVGHKLLHQDVMHRQGWQLTKLVCDVAEGSCIKTWRRTSDIAPQSAVNQIDGAIKTDNLFSGEVQTTPIPIEAVPVEIGVANMERVLGLDWIARSYSKLIPGVAFKIADAVSVERVKLPPAPEDVTPVVAAPLGKTLSWTASGAYPYMVMLGRRIDGQGVRIDKIEITGMEQSASGLKLAMSGRIVFSDESKKVDAQ